MSTSTDAPASFRTGPRSGSISTAEIKARIEAMFTDRRSRSEPKPPT